MNQKTILYLRTDISHEELIAGGSVTHTIGVIKGFKELGYRVIIGSSIMQNQLIKMTDLFLNLANPQWLRWLRWKLNCLLSNIFFTLQIVRFLRNKEITYIYQRYSILNCVGILVSRIKKIPLILEYNGSEYWVARNWVRQTRFSLNRIIKLIENFNLRRASLIVVVSNVLKTELLERGVPEIKILVVPNGVDIHKFDSQKLKEERMFVRKKYSISDCDTVIGFIGTFGKWHGIEMLAVIIEEILSVRSDVVFFLIGDGPLRQLIDDRLKLSTIDTTRVIFTGLIPSDQAHHYLAACDIFICPTQRNLDGSRFFGSPTKLFEYMSLAKPVTVSDLEQLGEIVCPAIRVQEFDHSNNWQDKIGFTVQCERSEEFIGAIYSILNAGMAHRIALGNNARKKIEENYTWLKHVQKIDLFYKENYGA